MRRAQSSGLRFSVSSVAVRGSVPPNKSFKPTPCSGVGHVLYATLARVRRPATGRLNSGVRRQKAFDCFAFQCSFFPASVGVALRSVSCGVASSVKSIWRAHTPHTFRWPASEAVIGTVSVPRLTRSLRLRPAESARVRVRAFPLRFSASTSRLGAHRHPPPPNNSFKPTPCRGIGRVLCATLARVRRPATGRLNSGVRR